MNCQDKRKANADLIDRLKARNPKALADIYDCYSRRVYSLLLRITHDRVAAEDLTQELFLRLWLRAEKFDSKRGTLEIWLLAIARNMALDHVRSSSAKFAGRLQDMEYIEQWSYSAQLKKSESVIVGAEIVKVVLSSLSPCERQVLELAYFEGYSQSEIADVLNEPLGTVKTRIRAALARARLELLALER